MAWIIIFAYRRKRWNQKAGDFVGDIWITETGDHMAGMNAEHLLAFS